MDAASADPVTVVVPGGRNDLVRSAPVAASSSDPTSAAADDRCGGSTSAATDGETWALQLPLAAPQLRVPAIAQPPRRSARALHAGGEGLASTPRPGLAAVVPDTLLAAVADAVAGEAGVAAGDTVLEDVAAPASPAVSDGSAPPLVPAAAWEVDERAAPVAEAHLLADAPVGGVAGPTAGRAAKPWTHAALEWIGIVAGALLVALVIKAVLIQAFVIPSRSMEPTLNIGDRVLVFKPSYTIGDIERGDVIVFERPELLREGSDTSDLIKRVIGLPGETIEGRDGRVVIDGAPLDEPWLADQVFTSDFGPIEVPQGKLWVMGDNRGNSKDSRVFGLLDESDVIGEAILRWWPAGRFGSL